MLVVSLTSIPPRFGQLPRVVAALRAQLAAPARILVTLPRHYRRFPGHHPAPDLPGAEILRPEADPGPIAKALHAARHLRGQPCQLLYCDDDWLYQPGWASGFLAAARQHPGAVICASGYDATRLGLACGDGLPRGDGKEQGYVDIAQGFAGVLIRPEWLQADNLTAPDAAWAVDDIWLSALHARAGRKICKAGALRRLMAPLAEPQALQQARIGGLARDEANRMTARHVARHFGIWR